MKEHVPAQLIVAVDIDPAKNMAAKTEAIGSYNQTHGKYLEYVMILGNNHNMPGIESRADYMGRKLTELGVPAANIAVINSAPDLLGNLAVAAPYLCDQGFSSRRPLGVVTSVHDAVVPPIINFILGSQGASCLVATDPERRMRPHEYAVKGLASYVVNMAIVEASAARADSIEGRIARLSNALAARSIVPPVMRPVHHRWRAEERV